ncbi:hypothetical protein IEQ34_005508 [Dendrobium chrysotoxum]|uniref:HTH cro/C1-type domain-containing protein n=1 Tax=Dendrobium chrysotoxum TaxID=161865 RepID=A0AAV7GU41_DENCH|nr:hypothetical protein IEQ34_005508 [Dendrobium chrysotoxum]
MNTRKLNEETESLSHDKLINEKPEVIQEYESGRVIPNQQIINKLERVVRVKLQDDHKNSKNSYKSKLGLAIE